MPVINFSQLFSSLETSVSALAEQTVKDEVAAAKQDGQEFLNMVEANVNAWSQQLADGIITADDFAFLVQSQKECGEMVALKNAGLAQVRIEQFEDGIINCIITTVSKII